MSLSARLFDLDDKIIYDISGGRHLWWMLPRTKDHRIIVTHDNNESMDVITELVFESLGYKRVDCASLSTEIGIDFSVLPENFYSIRVSLVDLSYGLYFNAQHLNWLPKDLSVEHGIDKESGFHWFKIPSVIDLLNCTDNLFSVSLSECYPSSFGCGLVNMEFVKTLKDFGKLVDNTIRS